VREVTSGTDRLTGIADDEGLLSAELRQLGETRADPDFETLHRTYSRRLFKQIIAITRHHADAEDALQDAFHNAYVALPLFERRCHPYSWLSRIAINCALMKIRQRRIAKERSFENQEDSDGRGLALEIPDQGWSPEDLCSAKESIRQLGEATSSLDAASQRMLHLRVNEGYSVEEIANALNVSESAVKARLRRARHSLRDSCPSARCG
jgi:RNA polymerase sigma-70 factor, ECF subfamily